VAHALCGKRDALFRAATRRLCVQSSARVRVSRDSKLGSRAQVELLEMPFTVITMAEVNIVNLERVGFNLRNFDMTVVFKARAAGCPRLGRPARGRTLSGGLLTSCRVACGIPDSMQGGGARACAWSQLAVQAPTAVECMHAQGVTTRPAAQDLTRDVVRIDAIPSTSLDTIRVRRRRACRPH